MPDTPKPPVTRKSSTTEHTLSLPDQQIRYNAVAEWQTLFEQEKPTAEMFHVAYLVEASNTPQRPLTFVFNGGPGAASAYLHMGALGPKRISLVLMAACPNLQSG
jgi:carboxypeptidase C (cathepsin A)